MRKFIVCVAVLITCLTVSAYGDNVPGSINETIGYVTGVEGGTVHISGEPITPGGLWDVAVQVGDAAVYDLITGLPISFKCIQPGLSARVAYDDALAAVVIWMNWDDDDAAVFTVAASENIQRDEIGTVFLSTCGRYRVMLTDRTQIFDYSLRKLSPADIVPGMEFFVWVDTVTASNPGMVYPDKVVEIY